MATLPLFQDVLVLAVGQEFTVIPGAKKDKEEKEEKTLANTITLALSPQETNLIAYVQEQGRIRLVLRSPGDTQIQPPIPGGWQTLFRTLFPRAYEPQPKADTAPGRKVEIIRGTQEREEQAY
jgi:Flp pilus assembly protein CpaB